MQQVSDSSIKIDCSYCPVRHRAVCSMCEGDDLARLNAIKHYKSFPAGNAIAMTGDEIEYVASIVSGVATLNTSLEDGRTQIVGLLLPSDFLGRPGRDQIAHDVVATRDVTLCCFRRKEFEALLDELPQLRKRLFDMALDELDAAREWMLLLGRKSAREKVASFLLLVARRSSAGVKAGDGEPLRVSLPLSREEMANYLGMTIETVSRHMTALRRDGLIDFEGPRTIDVLDLVALRIEAAVD